MSRDSFRALTMGSSRSSEASEFLEHYEFLQRLARGLLAGRDGAEDVVHDAWIVAHGAGGRPRDGGWLRGVVRNLIGKKRRGEIRRRLREHRVAPGDSYEPVESTLETQGRLLEAVSALPAIYRTVVVLRYYHELAPREIAAELELPVETVKTRLKRALKLLRGKLDDRDAFLGLGPLLTGLSSPLGIGILAMKKIAITLLALAALAALWKSQADPEVRRSVETRASDELPATSNPSPGAGKSGASGLKGVVRTTAPAGGLEDFLDGLPEPEPFVDPILRLQLLSVDGAALPKQASVAVTPYGSNADMPQQPVRSEQRFVKGRSEITLSGKRLYEGYESGVVQVSAEGFGRQRSELVPIRWAEGAVTEVSMELHACRTIPVLAVHALTGEAVERPRFMIEGPSLRFGNLLGPRETGVATLDLNPGGLTEDLIHVGGEGVATRTWTAAELFALPPDEEGVRRLELSGGCTLRGVIEVAAWQELPPDAEVAYQVINTGDGLIADPRRVAELEGTAAFDAEGRFEIGNLPPCTLLIRLRDQDRNFMKPRLSPDYVVEIPATATLDWRMVLPENPETLTLHVSWGPEYSLLFADLFELADEHDRPYSGREDERTLVARKFWLVSGKDATVLLPEGVLGSGRLYLLRIGHNFDQRIERFVRIHGTQPRLQLEFGDAERAEYPIEEDESASASRYDAQQTARQSGAAVILEARD